MPRILRIVNRFNLGGPTYNAAFLSKYLHGDFQTLLVGGIREADEDSSEFILQNLGQDYLLLPEMRRSLHWQTDREAYRRIRALIRDFKPDIVHTHASKAGAIGRLAARSEGVRHIVHTFHGHVFHSYFGKFKTAVFKQIERRLAAMSTAIIAISDQQAREIGEVHRICDPGKIRVIPLGFDLDRFSAQKNERRLYFRQQHGISDSDFVVGHVGRFAPVKNHSYFVEAFRQVRDANNTGVAVKAVLVGDGALRPETEARFASLGFSISTPEEPKPEAQIVFTSWIRGVEEVLPAFDTLALSSWNEGTPVSLVEAQAAGLPVVSTDVGGVRDTLVDGRSGFLCDVSSPGSMALRLLSLLGEPELRTRMGEAASEYAFSRFHYRRMVAEHEALYRSFDGN